ncbi:ammonium_transp domain-containing protein [Haematococcus lacustris]|uniref:Ammonium_transp domain-containing protein n=1 Tax=Haematococcus lacustris TaxID=44745 RepID=A0A699ZBW1_HAELA|nr:ammonium_transp domain-containing protein [Haematococcus lacustris]
MFALCCVTIVSGCMTERTQLLAYPVLTLLVTLLIHPVAVHWVWSDGGWLRSVHAGVYFLDFAGCTLVHMIGGVVGLVGAVCVGPRMGRFEECGSVKELRGHDMSSISMGTLMLWFGWFGFNVGSCYLYENPNMQVLNRVALNMTLTASSAGCIALLLGHWLGKGTFDLRVCCNGLLSGLVLRLRVDDPMDNAAVHLGGGALGTVLVGFLARPAYVEQLTGSLGSGVVYGSSLAGTQLGIQLLGLLVICLWAAVPALVVFKGLARCGLLRVDQAAELAGIDTFDHGGPGFPES